jgi:hypothetical protein
VSYRRAPKPTVNLKEDDDFQFRALFLDLSLQSLDFASQIQNLEKQEQRTMLRKLLDFVGGGLLTHSLSDLLNNFFQKHLLVTHLKSAYKAPRFVIRVMNAQTTFTINAA